MFDREKIGDGRHQQFPRELLKALDSKQPRDLKTLIGELFSKTIHLFKSRNMQYEKPLYLLFIEPRRGRSSEPVKDEITAKVQAALKQAKQGESYYGWHTCVCGKRSDSSDWRLPSGHITNALAVHYVAWHREEVPESELEKIRRFL